MKKYFILLALWFLGRKIKQSATAKAVGEVATASAKNFVHDAIVVAADRALFGEPSRLGRQPYGIAPNTQYYKTPASDLYTRYDRNRFGPVR